MVQEDILADALARAAQGKRGDVEEFFHILLKSRVVILAQPISSGTRESKTVSCFSSRALFEQWSGGELPGEEKDFKTLLWLLQGEQWLHLNPGAEVGKEFTPWEIELLRQGPDAIPEIVSDLVAESNTELEIVREEADFLESKKKLRILLESYPQVDEAFFILTREAPEDDELLPVVGLKCGTLKPEKRKQLIAEIQDLFEATAPGHGAVSVVTDLGDDQSHNRKLFADINPFYIAQKPIPKHTWGERFLGRIFKR